MLGSRKFMHKCALAALVTVLGMPAFVGVAHAQDATVDESADTLDSVEQITVTARKTEERLIDTPVSVSAITAGDIAARDITDMRQALNIAPNLYLEASNTGRADRSLFLIGIRGIIPPGGDSDAEQGASAFIDGAPMNGGQVSGFEDFERVEVLRGPQSAYFGRSTFSGAVNFVTKTPGDTFRGKVSSTFGNYGRADASAQVEGGIIPGVLKARISGGIQNFGGQYVTSNNPGQRLGEQKTVSLAGTLYLTPSSDFDMKLRVAGWNDSDGPPPSAGYGVGNGQEYVNCAYAGPLPLLNGANNWFCGAIPTPKASQINGDYVVTPLVQNLLNNNSPAGRLENALGTSIIDHYGLERRAREAALHMNYRFSGFELSGIAAWHQNKWQTLDDIDRRANSLLGGLPTTNSASLHSRSNEDWSLEGRLRSPADKPLRGLIGASYFNLDYMMTTNFILTGTVRALNFGAIAKTKTTGIFGAVEYDILPNLTASVEGRYQWDNVWKASPNGTNAASNTFKSFTPRFSLNFKPGDDSLIYASYAKGVKPGTFNPVLAPYSQAFIDTLPAPANLAGVAVGEEELKMGELGFKAQLLNRRVQIQAAVYYGDWRPQASITAGPITLPNNSITSFSLFINNGHVDVWGSEVEIIAVPVRGLTLSATLGYNGSEIKQLACGQCALFGGASLTGKRFNMSPEYQASLSASYEAPLVGSFDGFVRLDGTWHTETYGNNPDMLGFWSSPKATNLDMRFGVKNGTVRVEGFVRNLLDSDALTGSRTMTDYSYFGATPTRFQMAVSLPYKRSYGVRMSYEF